MKAGEVTKIATNKPGAGSTTEHSHNPPTPFLEHPRQLLLASTAQSLNGNIGKSLSDLVLHEFSI